MINSLIYMVAIIMRRMRMGINVNLDVMAVVMGFLPLETS